MNSTRYSGIPSAEAPDALYPTLTANKNAVRSNRFSGFRSTSLKRWTILILEIEISSTLSTKPHLRGVYPFVKAAQALFFLNAAIWFMFGASSLVRMAKGNPDQRVVAGIIAMLMLLLTVTDEFGLFDFLTLILDGILLGLLILIRPRR